MVIPSLWPMTSCALKKKSSYVCVLNDLQYILIVHAHYILNSRFINSDNGGVKRVLPEGPLWIMHDRQVVIGHVQNVHFCVIKQFKLERICNVNIQFVLYLKAYYFE